MGGKPGSFTCNADDGYMHAHDTTNRRTVQAVVPGWLENNLLARLGSAGRGSSGELIGMLRANRLLASID
jgi:hypothetical protein